MSSKSFLNRCEKSGINVESVSKRSKLPINFMVKNYVLVHHYFETGHNSILAFSDSYEELENIVNNHPRFGSSRHSFYIVFNDNRSLVYFKSISSIKDDNLINICKNVAEYLAIGEYAMLKKSYFKASAWFEKAKNSAVLGSDIIDNY